MNDAYSARRSELLARSEAQRQLLASQWAAIHERLQGADHVLGSLREVISRPSVLAGGAALLFTLGRSGWWPTLSRSLVILAAARRLYGKFKHD